jgi:riboflavin synthase
MFTGLIADIGEVKSVDTGEGGARLRIATSLTGEIAEGDSVAVSGPCLTAASVAEGAFEAEVMSHTLSLTTLGALEPGDRVNIELPLRAFDRLGGHLVQGHVDGVGEIAATAENGIARRVEVAAPADLMPLIVEHGSIAIDGVSLTVSGLAGDSLEVSLVPETLERTTLGDLDEGARVNLECDVVARYLQRIVAAMAPLKEAVE